MMVVEVEMVLLVQAGPVVLVVRLLVVLLVVLQVVLQVVQVVSSYIQLLKIFLIGAACGASVQTNQKKIQTKMLHES